MFRKALFSLLFIAVLSLTGSVTIFAQMAPISGHVLTKGADGKMAPVVGALVDVYRTDMKGTLPSAKTDKSGAFAFAGVPVQGKYAFGVSAPNFKPQIFPNVNPGDDKLTIILEAGDGTKLTEDEVRQGIALARNGGKPTEEITAEQKKQQEAYDREKAAVEAKNKKMQEGDAVAKRANDEGFAALKAQNYDLAVAKFDEGITAVPDFVGSTPILLSGRMSALKFKGFSAYREGAASTDVDVKRSKYAAANGFYDQALASFAQAMDVIQKAPAAENPAEQKQRDLIKLQLYADAMEIHRLKSAGGVDTNKAPEASKVVAEYISIESDPVKKLYAQTTLGDILRNDGDFEGAITAYRKALEMKPDHPEAMAGLGLTLFAQGAAVSPEDKAKEQEGLNYMDKYTQIAPVSPTDPQAVRELKQSVKETVEYLKNQQKMTPQKVPATTTTKKRGGQI